jgi:NADP-dependent aldehyde dehydrogenase
MEIPMTEFRSIDARTGQPHGPALAVHGLDDVACAAAEAAFDLYRATGREERAAFLERIAEEILAIGDPLIEAAMRESGLPRPRLEGERGRTVGQLRLFAAVVRAGAWQQLRIDPALPERQPLPRPDIRLRMIPLGPVAVFGASNFPLAFSTAGGDTASALAAGCPVVVKGHPAHPETGALVAAAIARAVAACGLPEGCSAISLARATIWARRSWPIRASRRWASPARAVAAWRWPALPRRAKCRSRSMPKCRASIRCC